MPKWNGGVIGVANNPTQSSAKGIWSLSEATKAIRAGLWPPSNAGADPYFENVTLLLPGDGTNGAQNNTFLDSSTNNFTITRNGNTTQGTFSPFSKVDGRWGAYFDGSGDYLTAPSNSAFAVGSVFTIEFWIYPISFGANAVFIYLDEGSGGLQFGMNSGNLSLAATGVAWRLNGSAGPTLNTWNHCVLVRSGTGTNQTSIFLNGTRIANGTVTDAWTTTVSALIQGSTSTYQTQGYMSNVRIVKGTAVYDPSQSTLTVPTGPLTAISGTSLLTCQSNRFIDNSTNAFAITRNGDVAVTTFSPFPTLTAYAAGTNGGSGYFDGSGDYLSFAADTAFAFGTGDYTVEAWVYFTSITTTDLQIIFMSGSTGGNNFYFHVDGNQISVGTTAAFVSNQATTFTTNQWYHIAACRSGTTLKLFVNGTQAGSNATDSTNWISSGTARVGSNEATTQLVNGYMSGVRVLKGTAQYTSNFTVPTAPVTNITNTSLLLNFTNGGIIDTSMSNDLETVGNAQISTTQSKFGGASMYFDGTGDYLVSPKTPNLVLGDTWTIECWYRPESRTDTYPTIVSVSPGNQNGTIAIFDRHQSYSSTFSFSVGSGAQVNCSTTVSNGTWYHLALVSNAGSVILYVNGTADNTAASRTTSDNTNRQVYVGCNFDFATYSTEINGYVDDLRITKGYARYTANFTAPSGPFIGFGD